MGPPDPPPVLILAANRTGQRDSVAAAANVSHKCLAPLAGRPMIAHVISALIDAARFSTLYVSIDDVTVPSTVPELQPVLADGRLRVLQSRETLAASVAAAVEEIAPISGRCPPLVVTTGDNALHTPALLQSFAERFAGGSGDVAVAFAREAVVRETVAEPPMRFHRLSDGGVSSCNLYGLRTQAALKALHVFDGGGQFAKRPGRILKTFGALPFVLYKLRWTSSDRLMSLLGRRLGVSVDTLYLPFGYGPIDIDNEISYGLGQRLLEARLRSG